MKHEDTKTQTKSFTPKRKIAKVKTRNSKPGRVWLGKTGKAAEDRLYCTEYEYKNRRVMEILQIKAIEANPELIETYKLVVWFLISFLGVMVVIIGFFFKREIFNKDTTFKSYG